MPLHPRVGLLLAGDLPKAEPVIEPLRSVVVTSNVEHDTSACRGLSAALNGFHNCRSDAVIVPLGFDGNVDDAPGITTGIEVQPADRRTLRYDKQEIRLRMGGHVVAMLHIELLVEEQTHLFGRPAKGREFVNAQRPIEFTQEGQIMQRSALECYGRSSDWDIVRARWKIRQRWSVRQQRHRRPGKPR